MQLNGKKTERMLLRVSDDMARSVRAMAELEHRSIQDQFRFLIAIALQQTQSGSGNGIGETTRQAPSTSVGHSSFAKQNTKAAPSTAVANSQLPGQLLLPNTAGPIPARKRKIA